MMDVMGGSAILQSASTHTKFQQTYRYRVKCVKPFKIFFHNSVFCCIMKLPSEEHVTMRSTNVQIAVRSKLMSRSHSFILNCVSAKWHRRCYSIKTVDRISRNKLDSISRVDRTFTPHPPLGHDKLTDSTERRVLDSTTVEKWQTRSVSPFSAMVRSGAIENAGQCYVGRWRVGNR